MVGQRHAPESHPDFGTPLFPLAVPSWCRPYGEQAEDFILSCLLASDSREFSGDLRLPVRSSARMPRLCPTQLPNLVPRVGRQKRAFKNDVRPLARGTSSCRFLAFPRKMPLAPAFPARDRAGHAGRSDPPHAISLLGKKLECLHGNLRRHLRLLGFDKQNLGVPFHRRGM